MTVAPTVVISRRRRRRLQSDTGSAICRRRLQGTTATISITATISTTVAMALFRRTTTTDHLLRQATAPMGARLILELANITRLLLRPAVSTTVLLLALPVALP